MPVVGELEPVTVIGSPTAFQTKTRPHTQGCFAQRKSLSLQSAKYGVGWICAPVVFQTDGAPCPESLGTLETIPNPKRPGGSIGFGDRPMYPHKHACDLTRFGARFL